MVILLLLIVLVFIMIKNFFPSGCQSPYPLFNSNIFIDMKPKEINIPKNYIDKTDETRNKLIRDMFPISEKKNEPKTKN